jgi:polar amino acid transport system substrate-binding protein
MLRKVFYRVVVLSIYLAFDPISLGASPLSDLTEKGELVVGTKVDYPPYGFQDGEGKIAGIEPDLATDLAKRLGLKLRLVPVHSSDRIELLNQRKVDILIATVSITDERRHMLGFIEPPYYAAGAALLARRETHITESKDLANQTVCAVDGNIYLLEMRARSPSIRIYVFKDVSEAEAALFRNECSAFLFNDNLLFFKKYTEIDRWKNYDFVPLTEIDPLLWGIAVRSEDQNSDLARVISQAVIDWHRSGRLLQIEKMWLGGNTPLLKAFNVKWSAPVRVEADR